MPDPSPASDQSRGSLRLEDTDPSGAAIYNRPAPGTQYFSPVTGQNYPMAPPDPGIGLGDAIWRTGGMIGRGIADVGRGIGSAFTGAAQGYLGTEQQLLSGQMSWPDLASFVAGHILPDRPGGLSGPAPAIPVEPLPRVPDWYQEANIPPGSYPSLFGGRPAPSNVVQFPASRAGVPGENQMAPPGAPGEQKIFDLAAERQARQQGQQPEGLPADPFVAAPETHGGPPDELRYDLAAWTGRDPTSFGDVRQEAQQYLNQMWLRQDINPAMRDMLARFANMHDLIIPDA